MNPNSIIEKVKELVREGNVSRIVVRKGDKVIVNISVNVGVGFGVLGLLSAKWMLLASVLTAVGFGCTVEVIKENDEVVTVLNEEDNEKVRNVFSSVADEVMDKTANFAAKAKAKGEDIKEECEEAKEEIKEEVEEVKEEIKNEEDK